MAKAEDILVAKSAGFCPGVKHAIEQVFALEAARKKPIYTLGPLIHNKQVTSMLERKDIRAIHTPEEATNKQGVLVIRAHGITPDLQRQLEACEMSVVDATCPLVKHAQNIIAKYAVQDYHTVIIGDAEHAEVIGLMGYAQNRCHVVSSLEEAKALPHFEKVNVVSQTTQQESVFYELSEEIKKHADICQISNTICQPTKDRQKETMEQAQNADLVIVVGGKHSANTTRLAALCRGLCKHVQHVETEDELNEKEVVEAKKIFITAGASTPSWVIDSVAFRVKTLRDRATRKVVYRYKPGEKK
ncbi:MAG: 4-hydroxy-3-methylbut-2-enyl diphosphate reductase [Elusimicrobiaceae bacterium]|nr:4-hydroxy-3-methylbut-2-enyl diphosphate reductase [Elusimicrobiaceae bacterium]